MNNDTLKLQTELKKAGYDPGPLDGIMGSKTRRAMAARDAAERHGAGESLSARIVRVAREQLKAGVFETSTNRGPGIDKLWSATTYPDGAFDRQPWCAAFVCWCVREAIGGQPVPFQRPTTPAAFGFDEWARNNEGKGVEYRVEKSTARAGDIVVFQFKTGGHIGIVIGRDDDGNLLTIEGNTNAAGSREGGAVLAKVRPLSSVRSIHRITA